MKFNCPQCHTTDGHKMDCSNKALSQAKPVVNLSGKNGNAFGIIAECTKAASKAGWSKDQINVVQNEMMSGDYDNLLQTACKYFEVE